MNKEIEKMARTMCEHYDLGMQNQPCTKCRTYTKDCYTIHQAKILYDAGYRKVDNIGDFMIYGFKNGYVKALIEKDEEIKKLKVEKQNAVKEFVDWFINNKLYKLDASQLGAYIQESDMKNALEEYNQEVIK